ncbi:MAG: phosphoribosylglycinamide formyltransferase [Gemmatimonadetes bacterium]|nr:phosphoribosylglycinamide formyltransferase [Gemmatimonadota bacterium]
MSGHAAPAARRAALFLDRDHTLIEDGPYLADPDRVALLPGAGSAVARATAVGVPVVIITNQSGIARGLVSADAYAAVRARTEAVLRAAGGDVLDTLHCPHHPELTGPCACRKPGLALYEEAARRHALDLGASAYIGDRWHDVVPALATGGVGILVPGPATPDAEVAQLRAARSDRLLAAASIDDAVQLALTRLGVTGPGATAPARIGVLASGGGSNLQALMDHATASGAAYGQVVWVGTDRRDAGALHRARAAGVAAEWLEAPTDGEAILTRLRAHGVTLLVLAGYLRLLPTAVVHAFPGRVVNVHPALLPAFGGAGMYGRRIHAAVLAQGVRVTGATVHLVDEQYDTGAILAQWPVPVLPEDTPDTLAARVLAVEHGLLPATVASLATGALWLDAAGRVRGVPPTLPLVAGPFQFTLAGDHRPDAA